MYGGGADRAVVGIQVGSPETAGEDTPRRKGDGELFADLPTVVVGLGRPGSLYHGLRRHWPEYHQE